MSEVEEKKTENMTEGMYIELCDQMKELNDTREKEQAKLKKKVYEYKDMIIKMYGLVSSADMLMSQCRDIPYEPSLLIDVATQQMREWIDTEVENVSAPPMVIEILHEINTENIIND